MYGSVTFDTVREKWARLPRSDEHVLPSLAKDEFVSFLRAPETRGWFRACHAWLNGGPSPNHPEIAEILPYLGAHGRRIAEIHLDLTSLLRGHWTAHAPMESELAGFASDHDLPNPLVRDLVDELRTPADKIRSVGGILCGNLVKPERSQVVTLLFVHEESGGRPERGVVADLVLESLRRSGFTEITDETGPSLDTCLYSAPALMFIERRDDFQHSIDIALSCARNLVAPLSGAGEIRWRFRERLHPVNLPLAGPSAGGAFALGIAKLLADREGLSESSGGNIELVELLRKLDLTGVSVTAEIDASGSFHPVGRTGYKLQAAALREAFPRIHTVVVAEGQEVDVEGLVPDLQNPRILKDPNSFFHIVRCPSLAIAIRLLSAHIETSWQIDCSLPSRNHDFVGRERLIEEIRRFIDGHDSGYLVLVGGMGKGKSTVLAEFIRQEEEQRDERLVCHIIDYQRKETTELSGIAACLYHQFRRKYAFEEPKEWAGWSAERRLDALLRHLSENDLRREKRKEVFFIDAADQAETSSSRPLLPGALRKLPPGVLGVITSRNMLGWIADWESVTQLEMGHHTDDREDIQLYLERRSQRLPHPLSAEFIRTVVSQPDPPVFFTVALRLRQLEDPAEPESEKRRLRSQTTPWILPPELLVESEALRRVAQAEAIGISETDFWRALGLVAVGRDYPSESLLRALGVWEEGRTDRVLRLAANFFEPRQTLRAPQIPFRFDHPGYYREVLRHLDFEEIKDIHRRLAHGCGEWKGFETPNRDYVLRYRISHLLAAHAWEELARVFGDAAFIVERGRRFGFAGIHADALAATREDGTPEDWREELRSWERFLRFRHERLRHFRKAYGQEVMNEFLPQTQGPFVLAMRRMQQELTGERAPFLRKVAGPPAMAAEGHSGHVTCISFCPDGRKVASGSYDSMVKVWDASSGELLADCAGHKDEVTSVSFSPDGCKIASGSRDSTVKVWDASSGELLADCSGHKDGVTSVSFSPDGRKVASGSDDQTVKVWDASSGELLADCAGHKDGVASVSFSPDGCKIASGSGDSTVKVWNASTGGLLADCTGHERSVTSASFCPDGRKVASGSDDHTVKVWDASSGELLVDCAGHKETVTSVCFSPDGRKVASGSDDVTVKVWDASSGELLVDCAGHKETVPSVCFYPDGRKVVSGIDDVTVKVRDASSGELLADCAGHKNGVTSVSFSPDGRTIASGSRDYTVKVWDASSGELLANCAGHEHWVESVSFSPDGRKVASGSWDNTVKVWDASSGELLADCAGHRGRVTWVSFSPDRRKVASGSDDVTVKVRDAESGELLADCAGHEHLVTSVSFSPDGRKAASGSHDHTLKVWDVSTGKLLVDCGGHRGPVTSVCFSPDGWRVASGSDDDVKVWDAKSGELLVDCGRHRWLVRSVCFSPDGCKVASGSDDRTVKVWDAKSGELLTDCIRHTNAVFCVSFSPDGRKVASGSADHTVKVWDAKSGELLADCAGHTNWVTSVSFSSDGRKVASGSYDHTVKVWDAASGACLNTLFFSAMHLWAQWQEGPTTLLIVADGAGRIYIYELIEPRDRAKH
jgi:WD40 repeat protein